MVTTEEYISSANTTLLRGFSKAEGEHIKKKIGTFSIWTPPPRQQYNTHVMNLCVQLIIHKRFPGILNHVYSDICINGLVQDCIISSAKLALEIQQSCTKQPI